MHMSFSLQYTNQVGLRINLNNMYFFSFVYKTINNTYYNTEVELAQTNYRIYLYLCIRPLK